MSCFPFNPKPVRLSIFFIALITPLTLTTAQDPNVFGNVITDLWAGGDHVLGDFLEEAKLWVISGLVDSTKRYTFCPQPILGGVNILTDGGYLERTYTSLPTHDIVYFSLKFTVIDLWNPTDSFSITIDGNPLVSSWNPGISVAGFTEPSCGSSLYNDLRELNIAGKVFHTRSSLTLRVTFNLKSSPYQGGLGIRVLNMILAMRSASDQESVCGTAYAGSVQGVTACACAFGYFQGTSSCQPCNSACRTCFGSSQNQCTGLQFGYGFDGYQTITCAANCVRCFGPGSNQCLRCASTMWNYWDYTCQSSCVAPNIQQGSDIKSCLTPCQSQGAYMMWDSTCSTTCDYPLTQRVVGEAKFCDYPCQRSSEMLFWNGVCSSTESCDSPAKIVVVSGMKICLHPCSDTSLYYYTKEGVCRSGCEYPYKADGISCNLDISSEDAKQIDQISQMTKISGLAGSAGGSLLSLLSLDNGALLFMTSLADLLQYIKYMNIKYPPKLHLLLESQNTTAGGFSFIPEAPNGLKNDLPSQELPTEFQNKNVNSNFLITYWRALLSICLVLIIILFLWILEKLFRKCRQFRGILSAIGTKFRWNFFLILFSSGYRAAILFTALEIRTTKLNSALSFLSLFLSILVNGLGLAVFIKVSNVSLIFKKHKTILYSNSGSRGLKKLQTKIDEFKILIEVYRDEFFLQQIFMLIFMVRTSIHYAIIGTLNDYPFIQSVALICVSLLLLFYLIIRRPFKKLISYIQQIVSELAVLAVNTCVLILAIMDKWNTGSNETRINIGNVIIWTNVFLSGFLSALIVIKALLLILDFYKAYKASKQLSKGTMRFPDSPNVSDFSIQTMNVSMEQSSEQIQNSIDVINISRADEVPQIPQGRPRPYRNSAFVQRDSVFKRSRSNSKFKSRLSIRD